MRFSIKSYSAYRRYKIFDTSKAVTLLMDDLLQSIKTSHLLSKK